MKKHLIIVVDCEDKAKLQQALKEIGEMYNEDLDNCASINADDCADFDYEEIELKETFVSTAAHKKVFNVNDKALIEEIFISTLENIGGKSNIIATLTDILISFRDNLINVKH